MGATSKQYRVRSATELDLPGLMQMRARAIDQISCSEYQRKHIVLWRDAQILDKYRELVQLQCLWVLGPVGKPMASSGLRLSTLELVAVFVDPACLGSGYGRRLVTKAEQAAASYGITRLLSEASLNAVGLYQRLGYSHGKKLATCDRLGLPCREMHKNLLPRQTQYQVQVLKILQQLGIRLDYGIQHKLPIQISPKRLVSAGNDCFNRPLKLTAATVRAWRKMQFSANNAGIELQIVSGYRNLHYQTGIIQRKLDQGQDLTDILKVSAAPGFSEHHTGCALDLNTPDCQALENEFADTNAYHWLSQHANRFGFVESYPQNNVHALAWEPWHWRFNRKG